MQTAAPSNRRHLTQRGDRIHAAAAAEPAALFAFDLLWLEGADFSATPSDSTEAALHKVIPANRRIRYARHLKDDCTPLWQMANELELEGIVAKPGDSPYIAGLARTWLKIKTEIGRGARKATAPG